MLDEVAWLFNLRGNEYGWQSCFLGVALISSSIPYNPVFFSYATITPTTATIYVDLHKLSADVKDHLRDSVRIRPYDAIFEDSRLLKESLVDEAAGEGRASMESPRKFLISTKASWALSLNLGGEDNVEVGSDR